MLYKKLQDYKHKKTYPMHMPGHKRNFDLVSPDFPLDLDITEIDGFDDLHAPMGILKETALLAARIYESREAFLLINGSSVGILAAIGAHTQRGDTILAFDNCHVSTPNAAELFGLDVVYITPDIEMNSGVPSSVTPQQIESALKSNPNIKLVIITSPSYEGVVSDISSIAEVTNKYGVTFVVDAAHGAHLGFSAEFPENHVKLGADIVVISLHKTLPALTQCALLHICSDRTNTEKVRHLLSVLQTTSPSYVLMSSIDYCLNFVAENSDYIFSEYGENLKRFYEQTKHLTKLKILRNDHTNPFFDFDRGKIVILTKNADKSGKEVSDILRSEYNIEIERIYDEYIIAMTSICDSVEGFKMLANALCNMDRKI